MKIFHKDAKPVAVGGLTRRVLGETDKLMLVEVTLPKGVVVPAHKHPHEQVTYVVEGKIDVVCGEDKFIAAKGDSFGTPSNVEHIVTALENSVVVDIFTPPREDFR